MKKLLLLLLGLVLAQCVMAQTVVVLEAPNPCQTMVGVAESVAADFDFGVFPNPADKTVTLSFSDSNPIGKMDVEVSDMKGVVVLRQQYYSSFTELRTEMQLVGLAPGVYTISAKGKETHSVKKLIIKK